MLIPYRYINNLLQQGDEQLLHKKFKEIIDLSQIDADKQLDEIRLFLKDPDLTWETIPLSFLYREFPVFIGYIYEQNIVNILRMYQLEPLFNNSLGNYVNIRDGYKMKEADVIVRSLKDNQLYAFDVKHSMVWRKALPNKLVIYNSGMTKQKYEELINSFKAKLEERYNEKVNIYFLLICYDMLTQINYDDQSKYYEQFMNDVPNHAEKVSFVIDIIKLMREHVDFENEKYYVLDKNLTNDIFALENDVNNKALYMNKYGVYVTSSICSTLRNFITDKLIKE